MENCWEENCSWRLAVPVDLAWAADSGAINERGRGRHPDPLEIWGPWAPKDGPATQEKALLVERSACLRDCAIQATHFLCPPGFALTEAKGWVVLRPQGKELLGQPDSCPDGLPNTHPIPGRASRLHTSMSHTWGVLPCSLSYGERSVVSKNSNLFLREKLPAAGPICIRPVCNEMLCWQVYSQFMEMQYVSRTIQKDLQVTCRSHAPTPNLPAEHSEVRGLTTSSDVLTCDAVILHPAENN